MKTLIAVLSVLFLTTIAHAKTKDVPNIFEPKRVSSESIFEGVRLCTQAGYKLAPKLGAELWLNYCLCAADNVRLTRNPLNKKVSAICYKHATSKNKNGNSPYFNKKKLVMSSKRIVGVVMNCVSAGQSQQVPWEFTLPYCGCLMDAARLNYSAEGKVKVTDEQNKLCTSLATLRERRSKSTQI